MHLIAYKSQSLIKKNNIDQQLENIIEIATRRNGREQITGALFFLNESFLQVIEGDETDLRRLMSDIEKDKRHKDVKYLLDKPIEKRGFANWNMHSFNLSNDKKFSIDNLRQIREGLQQNDVLSSQDIVYFYNRILK